MQIRLLIATLMLLLAMVGKAQVFQTNNTPMNFARGLKARDLLIAPKGCDTTALSNPKWGESTAGALFVDTCNNRLYFFNGAKWNQVTGGGGGVDSFYFNFRNLNDTTLLWDRGDGVVDTLAFSSGGTSLIGAYIDDIKAIGQDLYYYKNGDSTFIVNIAQGSTGGDTTIFSYVVDTTNVARFQIPYADTIGYFKGDTALTWQPSDKTLVTDNLYMYGTDASRAAKLWFKIPNPTFGYRPRIYAGLLPTDVANGAIYFSGGGSNALMEINSGDNNQLLLHSPDGDMLFKQTDGLYRFYNVPNESSYNKMLVINDSGFVAWKAPADTIGLGSLYIRNQFAAQESKSFNIRSGRLDSLYASGSGGVHFATNGGTSAFEYGGGGGTQVTFNGFAGYNANRAASYTARSFTDKNYVDSARNTIPTVTSYGKNAGGDSTILLLTNGQRFAAKDSTGGGGGGVTTVGTFSGSSQPNGASIGGSTITFGPADATNPGMVSTGAQTFIGEKTFSTLINIGPGTYPNLSYRYRSDLTVSGNPFGLWHYLPTSGDFRVHFNNGSFLDNAGAASLYLSGSQFIVRVPSSFTSLTATSFTTATGEKLNYNGGSGTSRVGIGSAFGDVMHYVPSGNNFRWHNSGQYVDAASSALMFLSGSFLSTTVGANIGTYGGPPTSAIFSTTSTTKGSIPAPIMTATQRDAISSPASGLRVFNSTTAQPNYRDGSTWQAQVGMTFGTAAPTSTPTAVGNFFLDTTNKKLYVATGTASSADWTILN